MTNASARARAAQGLARTFQQPELFMGLTVREHLVLAYRARVARHRLWRDMLDPRSLLPPSTAENERVDGVLELLQPHEGGQGAGGGAAPGHRSASSRWAGPWPATPCPASR